jgi:predicted nucleic acid-binding protein
MLADTDFILAMLKPSDWLKSSAEAIFRQNKGKISTSVSVMIEVALVAKKFNLAMLDTFVNIFERINVDDKTYDVSMRAALYMQKYRLNALDAFHAAYCDDAIISSDDAYDRIGLKRIAL